MGCQHLDDLYELFLLGALSEEDHTKVLEHEQSDCPYCLEQLRESALAIYFLMQMPKTVRPDPRLKAQLLQRLGKKRGSR